jgi:hypothetical protein
MGASDQHHAPATLYPRGKHPGTHCTGGWVGPRAGLDAEDKEKILCLCRGSNPVVQSVVRHYTDWTTPAHFFKVHFNIILHLRLDLPSNLFRSGFPQNSCIYFSSLQCVLHVPSSKQPWFDHPNSSWFSYMWGGQGPSRTVEPRERRIVVNEEYKLRSSSVCSFLQPPVTSCLLGLNYILFRIPFSNTLKNARKSLDTTLRINLSQQSTKKYTVI